MEPISNSRLGSPPATEPHSTDQRSRDCPLISLITFPHLRSLQTLRQLSAVATAPGSVGACLECGRYRSRYCSRAVAYVLNWFSIISYKLLATIYDLLFTIYVLYYQHAILRSKSNAVAERYLHLCRPRLIGNVIKIASGVRFVQIYGGWNHMFVHGT